MPTDKEIKAAKDWLLTRLGAERGAVSYLGKILSQCARRIVEISQRYNIPPNKFRFSANPKLLEEVKAVLKTLRDALFHRTVYTCTFGEEGEERVSEAVNAEEYGKTFRQRIAEYVSRWGYEVEAVIAAARLSGIKDANTIVRSIEEYLERPYDNPLVKEQQGKGDAIRLRRSFHRGAGRAIAAYAALRLLIRATIAQAYMEEWSARNADAMGFYVQRGSSFPCEDCDAECGYLHPMSDDGIVPVHPNCCCIVIYVRGRTE